MTVRNGEGSNACMHCPVASEVSGSEVSGKAESTVVDSEPSADARLTEYIEQTEPFYAVTHWPMASCNTDPCWETP